METGLITQLLGGGVLVFVIIVLAGFVLVVREWLTPRGTTQLSVNGAEPIEVVLGSSLLEGLAANGVALPAACGGRGNCGQCRLKVVTGGGEALPNERVHLSRAAIARGERLACMVTVREPLDVVVDEALLNVRQREFVTVSNRQVTPFLTELVMEPVDGEGLVFRAGQYVIIEAPPHDIAFSTLALSPSCREAWEQAGVLGLRSTTHSPTQRAYSIANDPHDPGRLTLVVRIALPPPNASPDVPPGKVSSWVFSLEPGDPVSVSGPFGDFGVAPSDRGMVLIAGGAGIAPIRSIILDQLSAGNGRPISFWYGARNAGELCYVDEFDALARAHENFTWHAALSEPGVDPDWQGYRGFIHTVVRDNYLADHPAPEALEYYLCGPPVMSAAVKEMLLKLGVDASSIYFDDFGTAGKPSPAT